MLISIMMLGFGRQEMLDITIPCWLKQQDADFEIVVGTGPGIKLPNDPRIREVKLYSEWNSIDIPQHTYCKFHNKILAECKGELVLTTQSDIQVGPTQLKRMLELYAPNARVTELFLKHGEHDYGNFLQCCLIAKQHLLDIGGWPEVYDNPEFAAHEDGDIVTSLFEKGVRTHRIKSEGDDIVCHIDHPTPDYINDPVWKEKVRKAGIVYKERHKKPLMYYVVKQALEDAREKHLYGNFYRSNASSHIS